MTSGPGCAHRTPCPAADAADRSAAVTLSRDYTTGWALLCNGVLHFDDTGELLPDGQIIAPAVRAAA
ncbi:hypothetical protein FQU76_18530 [Streptomyces qinzhouensis]|uniref:Uncharacterized protein n=1 Tax=Streptomyces qinzhouensis TaxID=2599401 RepID=A0A5B8JH17_9ACTN|nr:hypothetical protein FQU76_18530 [Streptomyces qinzhouensis]